MNYRSFVEYSSISMIITAFITFFALYFITPAPYGRYTTSKGFGMLIPAKIGWMIMESPNLIIPFLTYSFVQKYFVLPNTFAMVNQIIIGLFALHYINRTIIFPLRMPSNTNPMTIATLLAAFGYTSWNSLNQTIYFMLVEEYKEEWLFDARFLIGCTLFIIGMYINIQSDDKLLSLRTKSKLDSKMQSLVDKLKNPNEVVVEVINYRIPYGGMFKYVSCANYFGEILEWFGFALATYSLCGFAFAIYTSSNLIPRAIKHHRWYQEKFKDDYPQDRKAVIPFAL